MGGCGSTSAIKVPHEKRYRRAIKLYQVTEVKSLTNLLNRNKCFESGESPLTLAAQEGHEAVVQSLVASGADVNRLDNNGRGPLHIAVQLNDRETVDILLAANANPNKYDSGNATPLHLAAENGNLDLVRRLIRAGANVDDGQRGVPTALARAVAHGHADCAEELLKRGADPNVLDSRGNTLLCTAVRNRDARCTQLLLEHKASARLPSHDGTSLVCLACLTGCPQTLKLLVELADCDVTGVGGPDDDVDAEPPPVVAATVVGNADCIDVLLSAGADADVLDRRGQSALQIAVSSVVDVKQEPFYSRYFANVYRRYARYDRGHVSAEDSTRCAMSLVTGGANADRVWPKFAELFPGPAGAEISFEQMVLCEVLVQCYGFADGGALSASALQAFVRRLVAAREYGLLRLLYSAGRDPTWQDESEVGMLTGDGDREMYRWIRALRTNARSLRDLCRRRIRRLLSWNVLYLIRRLPVLSEEMKEYVCIMDTDHYSVILDDSQQQQAPSRGAENKQVSTSSGEDEKQDKAQQATSSGEQQDSPEDGASATTASSGEWDKEKGSGVVASGQEERSGGDKHLPGASQQDKQDISLCDDVSGIVNRDSADDDDATDKRGSEQVPNGGQAAGDVINKVKETNGEVCHLAEGRGSMNHAVAMT